MKARTRKPASFTERVMDEMTALLWVAALMLLALTGVRAGVTVLCAAPRPAEPGLAYATVRSGDSLWRIAQRCGATGEDTRRLVSAMCATNRISPNHVLQPGDRIFIPGTPMAGPDAPDTVIASR